MNVPRRYTAMIATMRMDPAIRVVLAILLAWVPLFANSQDPTPGEQPVPARQDAPPVPGSDAAQVPGSGPIATFTAQSDLVVLQVNVFDGRSDAVPELPESAFEVFEDGVPQKIQFFKNRDVPVATGLVIDNSSSMLTRRSMVAAGANAFAGSSHEMDEMFTIVFNENVRFGLPAGVPFTPSRALLQASFVRFDPGGLTALHDAVVEGLAHLEESTNQKRVLVVLSDGEDNASHLSEANMLHRAAESSALIYTIWTGDLSSRRGNPRLLKKLATRNGGVAYSPRSEREVVEAFTTIAANIRRVYSIGYAPTNGAQDGTYRRVKVLVHTPGKHLEVRARGGYMAPDGENAGPETR
jgi:Ca-activated chloride channel family protein